MAVAFNLTPDRVAVFDASFTQVFPFARPVDARVSERSKLLDHTIESGQIITDYSIDLPIEIEISFIIESVFYQQMYQQIRSLYKSKQLLTVQTLTASYSNMVIGEMPHDERPDYYDALPIRLSFRQIQLVPDPTTYSPSDPTQTDTQPLGQQNAYPVTSAQTTEGTQTTPSTAYSSVPPSATMSGTQFLTGAQSVNVPTTNDIPTTSVQTLTPSQSIGSTFQGVPIGSQ